VERINLNEIFNKLKFGEDAFHELMRWRIRKILLVLPHYDAWILEHDAKLSDQIVGEYHQLNLTTVPRLVTVADSADALKLIKEQHFDLMITGTRTGGHSPEELAQKAKEINPSMPVLMLLSSRSDMLIAGGITDAGEEISSGRGPVDARFLWTGDSGLLLAMIKYVEDIKNAPDDTKNGRVGVLLVVEDSIPFYSAYLPLLYAEIMRQTQRLIAEEMNDSDKYWRMRTRPKVLLARNWEEAARTGLSFKDSLIGIISDVSFHHNGSIDDNAGFSLLELFRKENINVPVLFQSSDNSLKEKAAFFGARFQGKLTGDLHKGIKKYILEELGFGDFVFRDSQGNEIKRVKTLREFEKAIRTIPADSLNYHAFRNDYSRWMGAHGEYQIASMLRKVTPEDFPDPEAQRKFLWDSFKKVRELKQRGRLVDFRTDDPGSPGAVARFGSGSLGGKGRGIAFFNALFNIIPWDSIVSGITMEVPRTLIIATGEFDKFLENSGISERTDTFERTPEELFLEHELSEELLKVLKVFSEISPAPIAVRSSSLLEDSQSVPFAGVYSTFMVPSNKDPEKRMKLLSRALRLVWASTFSTEAVSYRETMKIGRDEEKMAVVLQFLSGSRYGSYWFPRLSGTAQSLNYYPVGPAGREDGAARIAVGLGKAVVDGESGYMFCPKYPQIHWGSEEERWRESQRYFWALECGKDNINTLVQLPVKVAEELNVLRHMASTWDPVSLRIVDGLSAGGPRVVDFRDILEYQWIPLPQILEDLLILARRAMGVPVEIEFSLDWKEEIPREPVFSLLQVRPLVSMNLHTMIIPEPPPEEQLLLYSEYAMGHGLIENIFNVLWIDPDKYDPSETETYRTYIADFMDNFSRDGEKIILIGPGRWGSRDRFLGIPVSWYQVRSAALIVEVSTKAGDPEPSQGSHFFHNLVSLGVGYAHIPLRSANSYIDFEKLRANVVKEIDAVKLSKFNKQLKIVMDGKNGHIWSCF